MKNQKERAGMKGVSLVLPAIVLIIILLMLLAYINIPLIKTDQLQRDLEIRSEMHTMSNALDAAKLYMETSLEYSVYQACYDNLKKGGWDSIPSGKAYQGYALWDSSFQPEGFEFNTSLENSIASNLALYRGSKAYTFLSDYYVNLPEYKADDVLVSLEPSDPGWMFVTAFGDSNLYIQKTQESGEQIRLEKDSTLQNEDEYRIDCYGIYKTGTDIYALAKNAVSKAFDEMTLPKTLGQNENLDSKMKTYRTQFNNSVRQAIYGILGNQGGYEVSLDVISAELVCTQGDVTPTGSPITCKPEVYVQFEIANMKDDQKFPVYDGSSVAMSPMMLIFVGKF
jgi:hypothetical protein